LDLVFREGSARNCVSMFFCLQRRRSSGALVNRCPDAVTPANAGTGSFVFVVRAGK